MTLNGRPITLPIDPFINRCLGIGDALGERCERHQSCACHRTIAADEINRPTAWRKCYTDQFVAYLPMDGFTDTEEAEQ